jgi:hypothetical protein
MPSSTTVENVLATIKTDESKVLGLTIGSHKVTPGLKIPKAGKSSDYLNAVGERLTIKQTLKQRLNCLSTVQLVPT